MPNVFPIPAFSDNYIWVIQRDGTNHCVVVDPGDADPVLDTLSSRNLRLDAILITHHHGDHVGGVKRLLDHAEVAVYGPARESIPGMSHPLSEGDEIHLATLDLRFRILDIPGHTAGHIAYYGHDMLFCGDTLFAAGCGRLFEGTPEQMHASLQKLTRLPDTTRVYCGHEYTEANLRFARRVDPDNPDVATRLRLVEEQRAAGECTLPSSIKEERRTNPFLRPDDANVKRNAEKLSGKRLTGAVEVFAAVRRLKDAS